MNNSSKTTTNTNSISRKFYRVLTGDKGIFGTENRLTRDIWIEHTLAQLPHGTRILDAGAGELRYKKFCTHLEYVSQDFAQYSGKGDKKGLQTGTWDQTKLDMISDITDIPVKDDSFDAVMCIEVIEHLPDPIKALQELERILKPGGSLILTAPFCSLTHYSPYFYQTGYSRYFYEYWLEKLSFTIEDMQWNGNYFKYLAQELRRLPWASKTYANTTTPIYIRFLTGILLTRLEKLSDRDKGSEQLLSYGLHIHAKKKITPQ